MLSKQIVVSAPVCDLGIKQESVVTTLTTSGECKPPLRYNVLVVQIFHTVYCCKYFQIIIILFYSNVPNCVPESFLLPYLV